MAEEKFLTVVQLAERLSVGQYAVREWLKAGRLKGCKLPGGDWRIRPEDIQVLLGSPVNGGELAS